MAAAIGSSMMWTGLRAPAYSAASCTARCSTPVMQDGKQIEVEKPLTRTDWEARVLTQAAAHYGVATQMGNQGYSHEAIRVAGEILW